MTDSENSRGDAADESPGIHPQHGVKPEKFDENDLYSIAEPAPPPAEPAPQPGAEPQAAAREATPPTPPPTRPLPKMSTAAASDLMRSIDALFSRPLFFRIIARVSAALALLVLLGSVFLWAFGRTWFIGGVLLALIFVAGEAAAAILESLEENRGRKGD